MDQAALPVAIGAGVVLLPQPVDLGVELFGAAVEAFPDARRVGSIGDRGRSVFVVLPPE